MHRRHNCLYGTKFVIRKRPGVRYTIERSVYRSARPQPSPRRPREKTMDDASSKQAWIRAAVTEFEAPLMRYALRKTGCVEIARDVVQDTFLKLWQADPNTVNGRLAPWLYTVCRNRAVDVCRKERRMKTTLDDESTMQVAIAPENDPADTSLEDAEQQHDAMHDAVKQLNDRQQEAIRLKFQSGLSYKEIAEVMDITVNHVGVLLHNAIKTIREKLSSTIDGENALQNEVNQ